jgi:hypothetical protein
MKLDLSRSLSAACLVASMLLYCPALLTSGQAPSSPATPADAKSQNGATEPGATEHKGQVIFSRSADENGQATTTTGAAAQNAGGQMVETPVATDEEREAVTFTAFDMDVHLRPAEHEIAVRAMVTVRNDGKMPIAHIPLQISSSLNWERIRVAGHDVNFTVATLNSDVDHTGQLHEAAVPLAESLLPGATAQLDVTYSGAVTQDAKRLLAIGTPDNVAEHTDWDEIDTGFTGLRGFGNVVWYPAASVPAVLGMSAESNALAWQKAGGANVDSARVFEEMGEHKLRMSGARFRLHLAAEFAHGHAPTVALINGQVSRLTVTDSADEGAEVAGVATASADDAVLGFEAPSLFVAARTEKKAQNTELFALPGDVAAVEDWSASAAEVSPFLQGWLGEKPRSELAILDLPDREDAPFETGSMLATSIRQATPEQLDGVLAHALTHAWMDAPRAWVSEGLAHFMETLWMEHEHGRKKALEALESTRDALALAEPVSPGEGPGVPLGQAIAPIYYREKATYIFWMLRDLMGDAALSQALREYSPKDDAAAGLGANSGAGTLKKLMEKAATERDLAWFFADWVDADKGLPDLAIGDVFAAPTEAGNWLATVNLSNSGYAGCEVPVTLSTAETTITQRVVVPGRGKAVQRILIQGKPTEITANDRIVPETEASIHVKDLTAEGAR